MFNIGIGLTSKCNCDCKHCYSRKFGNDAFLNTNMLFDFLKKHKIESVNFGTGESFFHPDFLKIIRYLNQIGSKISVTTNGYTVSKLNDKELKMIHDVDFSLDYPNIELHDQSRQPGCFEMVINGINRCKDLGITCSIAWCLTPNNCKHIKEMLDLCRKLGVYLRVNIYKPVENDKGFSYDLFWTSINELFLWGDIISISEGIVNAAINNKMNLQGCNSKNLRIFPDGTLSSCVYIHNDSLTLDKACSLSERELSKIFDKKYELNLDEVCLNCDKIDICKSGCMARRCIAGLNRDEFCFMNYKNKPHFDRIVFSKCKSELFVHSNYICTIILEPRRW